MSAPGAGPTASDTVDRSAPRHRAWVAQAVRLIEADLQRSADTHLLRFPLTVADPGGGPPDVDLYLKDESTHVTGSLKHRLARSLFLYSLCNGWLTESTTVIEASSGSTAVSEAYFARMVGLPFVAVMPSRTSREKIELIEAPSTPSPAGWRPRPAVITWTSSPTPSGRPTGVATTTSPSRSSPSSGWSGTRSRSGSSSVPALAGPAPPSAGTSGTAVTRPGCASPTRRARRSSRPGGTPTRTGPAGDRRSRASAGRGSSRPSSD